MSQRQKLLTLIRRRHREWLAGILAAILVLCVPAAAAVNITGTWSASFDSQIGHQDYTYQFEVKGKVLTGAIRSANGESAIEKGIVDNDTVTFVERMHYHAGAVTISYSGVIVSDDEIRFVRSVGNVTSEELLARRVR